MIRRGQVWIADLGKPQGREQALLRPVVILQVDLLNEMNTVVIVPFTSQTKRGKTAVSVLAQPGEGGLRLPSLALCHQIRALDVTKLQNLLGQLPQERLYEIESVVAFVLGLPL